MQPKIDLPLIIASLFAIGILGVSALLWVKHVQRPRSAISQEHGAPAWPIGWINFGIFSCAIIIAIVFAQNLGAIFLAESLPEGQTNRELTPQLAIIFVLLLQLPMLAVFCGARRFYPAYYASRLNNRELSTLQALGETLPLFAMLLPIIWLSALVWTKSLELMQKLELVGQAEPQELVALFQGGGDPIAIGILVLLAVILAPIVEEIIFRGCLYRFLKSQTAILPAQIISGFLFSLIHGNLYSFAPLLIVGILLARVYERSGSIIVSICFHSLFNSYSLLMLFLISKSEVVV